MGRRRVPRVLLFVVMLCAPALAAFEAPSVAQSVPPTPFFADGFESGGFGAWTTTVGLRMENVAVRSGSWAARSAVPGTPSYAERTLGVQVTELYARVGFLFRSRASQTTLVRLRTSTGTPVLAVGIGEDGKLYVFNQISGVKTTSAAIPSNGEWHEVQLHAKVGGGSGSRIDVWLDGTSVPQLTRTTSLGTAPLARLLVGEPQTGRTFDLTFDDVIVDDVPIDDAPPPTPRNLVAAPLSESTIEVRWDAVSEASSYRILGDLGGGFDEIGSSNDPVYTHTGLPPGTTVTYVVESVDTAGNRSPPTGSVAATTLGSPDDEAPSRPDGLEAGTVSGTTVDLAWHPATDDVGVRGYSILRSDGASFTPVGSSSTTSFQDRGLTPETTYRYAVEAFDAAGNRSDPSDELTVTTGQTPPDVVVINTDDQRPDELRMPIVASRLAGQGVTFSESFVVDPLCCPSRLSLLRGQYSHTTGIYGTAPKSYGGFPLVRNRGLEASTLATWLDAAGYRTALVGKYLNMYGVANATYVPPGWDEWRGLAFDTEDGYYGYVLSDNGVPVSHGTAASDYSTDVLAAEAEEIIRSTPTGEPLFLYFAPRGAHQPTTPAPRHAADASCATAKNTGYLPGGSVAPPSFDEVDVADKPAYVRSLPRLTATQVRQASNLYIRRCRTLLSVDEAVGTILEALADGERLSNSLVVFTSDNGLMLREHRLDGKKVPYEESIRVPMIVRFDPLTGGRSFDDDHLVLNVDIAATILDATEAAADVPQEGTSLLPLLDGSSVAWRTDFLIEHADDPATVAPAAYRPTYCAVRTQTHLYAKYVTGEEELYDLIADPFELVNRASDPAFAELKGQMHARMVELCSPPPPMFTP